MSKSKLLATLILAAGVVTSAMAQSNVAGNVTVYGVMDASLQNNVTRGGTKDYDTNSQLRSNGSLFGIRGGEDLGDGNSVKFQFETGINTLGNERGQTSANNGTAFGTLRDTYVSLNSKTYGSVAGGYMSTPYRSALVSMEIFPGAGIDLTPSTRATGIQYTLPSNPYNVSGALSFSGDNTPSGTANVTGTDRIVSGNLGWGSGDWRVIGAFQQTGFVSKTYPVQQSTNTIVGTTYTGFPGFRLSAIAGHNKFNAVNGGEGTNNTVWLGGAYRTGNHELRASWARNSDITGLKGAEDSSVIQLTTGYAYHLSKRTQVYGVYTNARTGSQNAYNFTNSPVASITTMYALGDATSLQAYGVGIRHSF